MTGITPAPLLVIIGANPERVDPGATVTLIIAGDLKNALPLVGVEFEPTVGPEDIISPATVTGTQMVSTTVPNPLTAGPCLVVLRYSGGQGATPPFTIVIN
jgi:hypothetical protein